MMTELDHITEFINSPAFPIMSESVKAETYAKQKELAMALVNKLFAEHIEPVIQKYGLKINVSLAETKKEEQKSDVQQAENSASVQRHVSSPSNDTHHTKRAPSTGLCVWLPDGSFIQEAKATATFAEAIRIAGSKKVMDLNIIRENHNLISTHDNYPLPMKFHVIERGYYVNVHSNTLDKFRVLQRISKALNLNWKIEIVD